MTAATPGPCPHPGAHVVAHLSSDELQLWTVIAQTGLHDGSLRRGFDLGHDAEETSLDAAQTVQQTPSRPQP